MARARLKENGYQNPRSACARHEEDGYEDRDQRANSEHMLRSPLRQDDQQCKTPKPSLAKRVRGAGVIGVFLPVTLGEVKTRLLRR